LQIYNIDRKKDLFRHALAGARPSLGARFGAFSRTEQGQVMLWIGKSVDNRQAISRADLVSAITDAVKHSDPECAAFVDVIVQPIKPKSQFAPNWAIKGIRFGRSDRLKATQAIDTIVARMQDEFRLTDEAPQS
jgi:hypothetical protein